jgi:hypothetical protein
MRTTTTAVLAVGATALAIPTAANAQVQSSVQAPLAGHLTVASQMRAEHTELAQQRLTRKAWRLADRLADVRDRRFSPHAYGKYQFTLQTWQSVGGSGNPAGASVAEQNRRAAMLYAREGASPWPVCGR